MTGLEHNTTQNNTQIETLKDINESQQGDVQWKSHTQQIIFFSHDKYSFHQKRHFFKKRFYPKCN